jgi:hypothetical protein
MLKQKPAEKKDDADEEKKEADEDDAMEGLSEEDKAALETARALSMGAKSPGIELPIDFQVRVTACTWRCSLVVEPNVFFRRETTSCTRS